MPPNTTESFLGRAVAFVTLWPFGSTSLANAPNNSLSFLSAQYVIAGGPTTYNAIFGLQVPCYAKGTKILTSRGYIPVEDLSKYDMVISNGSIRNGKCISGFRVQPILWKGHFTARGLDNNSKPICIKKNAFGVNKPFEDLYVSPGHSILVSGKMINADLLINGTTIYRVDDCDEVTYYHVELYQHSAIVANGIAAESYKESDNRTMFRKAK